LYSATTIMPGKELYVHYGKSYESRRDYQVGEAAKLRKRDIANEQLPRHIQWLKLPPNAWKSYDELLDE
jgi:hypothetical protein